MGEGGNSADGTTTFTIVQNGQAFLLSYRQTNGRTGSNLKFYRVG